MKIKKVYFRILFFAAILSLSVFSSVFGQGVQKNIGSDIKNSSKIINVKLYKQNEDYQVRSLDVITGEYPYLSDYATFKNKISNGVIISFLGDKLGFFGISGSLHIVSCGDKFGNKNGEITGGCEELPEGDLTVQLPYFSNGKYADIFDPSGKKVLTIDLTSKATCNENDQCDRPIEDGENCPQDCKKNEPKLDPAVVQLAANNQAATQEAEKKISFSDLGWWGIAILIILLAGGGIGYWVYRKNRESD